MTTPIPADVAREWWSAIDRADFSAAADLLATGTCVDWPLSHERIPSPDAWRLVNEHYPGSWNATIIDIISEGSAVITSTQVSDGDITVLAISRFTVEGGQIVRLVEFWPETYAAPTWRTPWVVPLPDHENPIKRQQEIIAT